MLAYLSLFGAAFLAATILPFYSEILFVGLRASGYQETLLWASATLGNTLGAAVNWGLGRFLLHYRDRRWFPVTEKALYHSQRWFQRFGAWSLLFAWLPVGGDGLTFIAGVMRVRFPVFLLLTGIGKGIRYALLLLVV